MATNPDMALTPASMMNESQDIPRLVVGYLSDQYLNTAGLSRKWKIAWGELPKTTRGVNMDTTPDQFVSHLQLGYDFKSFGEQACKRASSLGKIDLLHAAYSSGSAQMFPSACEKASVSGRLEVLKYLRLYAVCPWDSKTLREAALAGHTNVVKWCIENDCPSDNGTLLCAAGTLNENLVLYLLSHGHKLSSSVLAAAVWAGDGAIKIIDLARRLGYVHPKVFSDAIDSGNLCLIKKLDASAYPWNYTRVMSSVRRDTVKPEIVTWLSYRGYIG